MKYSFTCFGHENITAKHTNTLEFTKDDFVTPTGDCIVGCRADFDLKELKEFIQKIIDHDKNVLNKKNTMENNSNNDKENKSKTQLNKKIKIRIEANGVVEEIVGILNPDFNDSREIVIRKSDFVSERTLIIGADKGAVDLKDNFKALLSKIESKVTISLEWI